MNSLDAAQIAHALLANALAQRATGATQVEVHAYDDGVLVRDDGEGLPVHPHPGSGRPLLEVILTGPRRGPLNTLARVTRACLWLEATVFRSEGVYRQRYDFAAAGELRGPTPPGPDDPVHGTSIRCEPAQGQLPEFDSLALALRAQLKPEDAVRLFDHRVGRDFLLTGDSSA